MPRCPRSSTCGGRSDKRKLLVSLSDQTPGPPISLPRRESLVSQTAASLLVHLEAGYWRQRLPAERRLCRLLQVSRPTLRCALRQLERDGRIRLAGRTRRYIGPEHRHRKAKSPSGLVNFLAPLPLQAMAPTTLLIMDAVRENLSGSGHPIRFHVDPTAFSPKPGRALERLLAIDHAATWVAWGSKEPMQRWFLARHLPLLVIGSCGGGIPLPSVDVDFRATCRHAANLLLRKGHVRLGLVLQKDVYDGDVESERGFREAVEHHSTAQFRIIRHDGTTAGLCSLMDAVLRSRQAPTGYLVIRAGHALTVAMHLMRRKIRLPQDMAVLSRDDEPYLAHTSPALSRYAINADQFARRVCDAVRAIAGVRSPRAHAVRLMPRWIAGETV